MMEEKSNCKQDPCTCQECTCEEKKQTNKSEEKPHKKKTKEIEEMKQKIIESEKKIQELEERILREKAETINYRKRKEEDTERLLKYSLEDFAKEMLPILDNFENGLDMDDDNPDDEVSKFLSGFKMIYNNLLNVFEQFEIKPIGKEKEPFDPAYHQAILTEKIEGIEEGIVLAVLRKGYMLKDRVIRPAMVKVSE